MNFNHSVKSPLLDRKLSYKKDLHQTRINLFKNVGKTQADNQKRKLSPFKIFRFRKLAGYQQNFNLLNRNVDHGAKDRSLIYKKQIEQQGELKRSLTQNPKKNNDSQNLLQAIKNLNHEQEQVKISTAREQVFNRKRRATEGSYKQQNQIQPKEPNFHIRKRVVSLYGKNANEQFVKSQHNSPRRLLVNYEKFICLYSNGQVDKNIEIKNLLGTGAFSQVREGVSKNGKYSIKIYSKKSAFTRQKKQRILNEINSLATIPIHPNVIALLAAYQQKNQIHLIFEHIPNCCTLLSKYCPEKRANHDEGQYKQIFHKLVRGVAHLHAHGLAHRDIKPANIVIGYDEDNQQLLKIIDFGSVVSEGQKAGNSGTPNFIPPQGIAKTTKGDQFPRDVWALGVILYWLFEGEYPFKGNSQHELYINIQKGKVNFHKIHSDFVKNIISSCLQVNPLKRVKAQQLLKNEWFFTP